MTFTPAEYVDLNRTEHRMLFDQAAHIWDALKQIPSYLQFRLKPQVLGKLVGKPFVSEAVFVGRGTVIEHGAMIKGPAWIGEDCEIRNGVYIRENVIIGSGCVIGNSCELKNSVVFDDAQIPHFNYVGDSILGYRSHLGAGVILSNVKLDHSEIVVNTGQNLIPTGLKKFGAILGDRVEVGCNSVRRGICPPASIVKTRFAAEVVARRG
jgi:UDP-N-acetylglucosamine diphosphorylase / glucose-1-phosphate thymidylyltransferase / UDP-N-acetylgalactosamine diphosphorylase / glucosamine-1-phosphate N-acetyltransferase / galactosamine-1-phosphate N-acetyltransferase